MNKKEKRTFEKQLKNDLVKYLVSECNDMNDYNEIKKAIKNFDNKYYTEIKYKLKLNKDNTINIIYKED